MKLFRILFLVSVLVIGAGYQLWSATDQEHGSQGDSAARYVIEAVYESDHLKIVQFKLGVLAHYSYIIESDGKALVVDPGRDIAVYLDHAQKNGLEWAGTLLTHTHADFVAGHREMTQATGAPIYASQLSGNLFPHLAVNEGQEMPVGKAVLQIIETPGHTSDAISVLVSASGITDGKKFLLSGDSLFVGGIGRPDVMGEGYSAAELAGMMFTTWNEKLAQLPDSTVILPAHGAGCLCGIVLGDAPSSTIGKEKAENPFLKLANNRNAFISAVISGIEDAPAYFKENAALNRRGPELVDWNNPLQRKIDDAAGLAFRNYVYIVDVRSADEYAVGHIPGSLNIMLKGRLERWVGTLVPFSAQLILRGNEIQVLEAARRLHRVGYKADYFDFGASFNDVKSSNMASEELLARMEKNDAPLVVDVRSNAEWREERIGEIINLELPNMEKLARTRLNPSDEILVVCNSSYRSSIAVGLLERAGFSKLGSLKGGGEDWLAKGLPVKRSESKLQQRPTVSAVAGISLPKTISAKELLSRLKAQPESIEPIDIRPPEENSQYNPLKLKPVDLNDLLGSDSWLSGEVPLLIIDRDGSLALMVAGILACKTSRSIMVLQGGIEEIWKETEGSFFRKQPAKKLEKHEKHEKHEMPDSSPSRPEPEKTDKKRNAGC